MAIVAKGLRLAREDPQLAERVKNHFQDLVSISEQWDEGSFAIPQGYTYLGQFLAHDLAGRENVNSRSPKLDLDSVYPDFEDARQIDQITGRFRFKPQDDNYLADFLRDPASKEALIPEFRNDDHFVIAQLHLHLQFFHNLILDHLRAHHSSSIGDARACFAVARDYLCVCFQKIILEEYLPTVCDRNVYAALWRDAQPMVIEVPESESTFPYEITHAAGRYGHPQVRRKYVLNTDGDEKKELTLKQLFDHSGHNPNYAGAPLDMRVDWSLFFYYSPREIRELSQRINPSVVEELRQDPNPDIVQMNLLAGLGKALPSGQEIARLVAAELRQLGVDESGDPPLGITPDIGISRPNKHLRSRLDEIGLWDPMPLWFFILVEADNNANGGLRLGPLGSLLLIETVKNATRSGEGWDFAGKQQELQRQYELPIVSNMYELLVHAQSTYQP